MKVLLVNPAATDLYSEVGADMPPLGLAYIAAVLKKHHYEVEIRDKNVDNSPIDYGNYAAVGISSLTPTYPEAISIAEEAKKSGAITVMGGYHPTFLDEDVLKTGYVDFIVRGEGEYIFLNLLEHLKKKTPLDEVRGISYLSDNKIIRTPNAIPPEPLDDLSFPARELLKLNKYHTHLNEMPMATIVSSRGCPFNCFFCSSSLFGGRKWRARSPKNIVDEIEILKYDYGYQAIDFVDDNFTLNAKRTIAISKELVRRDVKMPWWALSRADILAKNENMIKLMAKSGAYMVFIGMESPDDTVLKFYHKKEGKEVFIKAVNMLKKYGIKVWASFMLGAVKETKKMVEKTINFAKELSPDAAQFSILTPYPGTALFEFVKDRIFTKEWHLFDGAHSIFRTDFLPPKQLQYLLFKSYATFYLRPEWLFKETMKAVRKHRTFKTVQNYGKTLVNVSNKILRYKPKISSTPVLRWKGGKI